MSPWCIDYVPSYFVGVASAFALPACAFTTIDPVADMYRDGVARARTPDVANSNDYTPMGY